MLIRVKRKVTQLLLTHLTGEASVLASHQDLVLRRYTLLHSHVKQLEVTFNDNNVIRVQRDILLCVGVESTCYADIVVVLEELVVGVCCWYAEALGYGAKDDRRVTQVSDVVVNADALILKDVKVASRCLKR